MKIFADSLGFPGVQGGKIVFPKGVNDLNLMHVTAAPPFLKTAKETIAAVEEFIADLEEHSDRVAIVKNGKEIHRIIESGKIAVILGLQHTPEDADEAYCKRLQELNIKIVIPDYNGWRTSGSWSDTQTTFAINWLEKYDGIIDLSHASHEAARVFLKDKAVYGKIIVSHTGCYDFYKHGRNLPDDVLRKIAELGGYIGVSAVTFYLGIDPDKDMENFHDHITHLARLVGHGNLGIGSDIPYVAREEGEWRARFELMGNLLDLQEGTRFPDFPQEWAYHKGGKMEFLSETMKNFGFGSGFSSEETNAITGKNFYRWAKNNI